MKRFFYKFSVLLMSLSFFCLVTPADAKIIKPVNTKKISTISKSKKIQTNSKKKQKVTINSGTKKVTTHAFSAAEASKTTSFSGKLPPPGYMEALKEAEDNLFAAKAKAHGNKEKIDAAIAEYDQALNNAQQLLN